MRLRPIATHKHPVVLGTEPTSTASRPFVEPNPVQAGNSQ
jgi:hypothetical protein